MIRPIDPDRYPTPPGNPDTRERHPDLRGLPASAAPADAVPPGMVPVSYQEGYVTRVALTTDVDGAPLGVEIDAAPLSIVRSVPAQSIRHERLAAEARAAANEEEN